MVEKIIAVSSGMVTIGLIIAAVGAIALGMAMIVNAVWRW